MIVNYLIKIKSNPLFDFLLLTFEFITLSCSYTPEPRS